MAKIKKAIYSEPYVHVLWDDGTKTSSKCDEHDTYDELTGFLMCIMKKTMKHRDMRNILNTFVYGNDKKYVKRDVKRDVNKEKFTDVKLSFKTSPSTYEYVEKYDHMLNEIINILDLPDITSEILDIFNSSNITRRV